MASSEIKEHAIDLYAVCRGGEIACKRSTLLYSVELLASL